VGIIKPNNIATHEIRIPAPYMKRMNLVNDDFGNIILDNEIV
jgi:hypothetical protein